MRASRRVLVHGMDETKVAPLTETDAPAGPEVPVLVTLGDADVPVCEDGSCAL